MHLVKNDQRFWEFIRNLRNDKNIKIGFINQDYITEEQQDAYMSKYNDNYMICFEKSDPVGYIGEVDLDIRLAVVKDKQGRGIGEFMLKEFNRRRPDAMAKVIIGNYQSKRLFERCEFTLTETDDKFYYFKKV